MAAECDETARLAASERKARSSSKLVDPDRLREAVSRYIDWEALAYWAQPALERFHQLPAEVVCELEQRCPGFLELKARQEDPESASQVWQGLMLWIADHFFQDAKTEGWFDAILIRREVIRGRFAPWNMPTTAMRSGVQQCLSLTRFLRTGAEKLTLLLTWTTEYS